MVLSVKTVEDGTVSNSITASHPGRVIVTFVSVVEEPS
jgi:hypothetical protein